MIRYYTSRGVLSRYLCRAKYSNQRRHSDAPKAASEARYAHNTPSKEKFTMSEASDLQERLDLSEAKNRLNNWTAITVAIISVFMAISKVKDDTIVQAMLQTKSDAVDTWNEYQAKKIKQHMAELGVNQVKALQVFAQGKGSSELLSQQRQYQDAITRYQTEEDVLAKKAKEFEKQYDDLNFRDDQFGLSDAALSISLAMLAIAALSRTYRETETSCPCLALRWFRVAHGIGRAYGTCPASDRLG
jgi:hypothetical protein